MTTNHWRRFCENLSAVTLKDIMMKLNHYDIEFKIPKGEKQVIADILSRVYVKVTDPAENRLNE